jgi:uridine phosphorylase
MKASSRPPLLRAKHYRRPSVFQPDNLLREARRQKNKTAGAVPPVCVLDPDGDVTAHLVELGWARKNTRWACYHTHLYDVDLNGQRFGLVPVAVGASFAVLVAEELFASGCRLLVSVTSAGLLNSRLKPPFFLLIEKALRDEGTSYHYCPPSDYSAIDRRLAARLVKEFKRESLPVLKGATWTTDAPFRETSKAIAAAKKMGLQAVEMEAAALYAFAKARRRPVVCYAFVTNQMAAAEGDFEKGHNHGVDAFLAIIKATSAALR